MAEFISIADQLVGRTEAFAVGLAIGGIWVLLVVLFAQRKHQEGP